MNESKTTMPEKSFAEHKGTQLAMLLLNLIPLCHAAGTIACFFLPLTWSLKALSALAFLYILPLVPARILRESLRKSPSEIPIGSANFLKWWACFQCQVIFLRFPSLEEIIRLIPGCYSLWLRLWGSRVGKFTYWAPLALFILDRGLLIGDNAVFGAGVKLNPHVMEKGKTPPLPRENRPPIPHRRILPAHRLHRASDGETVRAFLISCLKWKDNKRIRESK